MTRAPSAGSSTIASEVSLIALALAGCGGLGLYAAAVEPRLLRLRQPVVHWPGWPEGRAPLRIGVLADLHAARPHMSEARIGRIAARLLAAGPDLVLLPGDFVSTHTPFVRRVAIERVAEALAALAAAVPTVAVLGNHDWYVGGARVARVLAGHGIRVLRNEAVRLDLTLGPVWVAGVDDQFTGRADLGRALAAVDATAPALLLSHVPDIFLDVPAEIALTVAGHTHGGQVCLPGYGALRTMSRLPRRLVYGLNAVEGRHLYVSGGVGTTALPIRFCRPPEIALLTLAGPG